MLLVLALLAAVPVAMVGTGAAADTGPTSTVATDFRGPDATVGSVTDPGTHQVRGCGREVGAFIDVFNSNLEAVPGFVRDRIRDSKVHLDVDGPDGGDYTMVTGNESQVVSYSTGIPEGASLRVVTDCETFREIVDSSTPSQTFTEAYNNEEIEFVGIGAVNWVVFTAADLANEPGTIAIILLFIILIIILLYVFYRRLTLHYRGGDDEPPGGSGPPGGAEQPPRGGPGSQPPEGGGGRQPSQGGPGGQPPEGGRGGQQPGGRREGQQSGGGRGGQQPGGGRGGQQPGGGRGGQQPGGGRGGQQPGGGRGGQQPGDGRGGQPPEGGGGGQQPGDGRGGQPPEGGGGGQQPGGAGDTEREGDEQSGSGGGPAADG